MDEDEYPIEESEKFSDENLFVDLEEISFYQSSNGNILGRLQNGKFVIPNRSEDQSKIILNLPYVCAIRNLENVAFAKLLAPVYTPRVIVRTDRFILVEQHNDKVTQEIFLTEREIKDKIVESKLTKFMVIWDYDEIKSVINKRT